MGIVVMKSRKSFIVAATLGAVAIERHIALDRSMYGSDQSSFGRSWFV